MAAANTAGVVPHKTLYDAAGVTRRTGERYDSLLELLFLTEQLPSWSSNRLNRLTRTPKRHLVEPALLAPLLGVDPRSALRDVDLLGRLLDTFVLSQLRTERESSSMAPLLYHLRQEHGRREIDLIAEAPDGRIVAIEVKATSAPDRASAEHLVWLKEQLGENLVTGIVFHAGPKVVRIEESIWALPISSIWDR
jgi:predicted AAA+ superfamily ATPase